MVLLVGCGPGDGLVHVAGKITRDGGSWPTHGVVYFACEEVAPGFDMQMGQAEISSDGSYSVDLVPGKYVLNLEIWEVPPGEDPTAAKSYVPADYQSGVKSGFTLEVPVGSGRLKKDFDVPTK